MPGAHTAPGKVLLCIQGKYSGPESSQLSGSATFSRRCRTPKPKNNDDAVMPDDSGMPYLCYESSIGSPESLSLSGLAFFPFQGDGPPVYRPQMTRRESSPPHAPPHICPGPHHSLGRCAVVKPTTTRFDSIFITPSPPPCATTSNNA